MKYSNVSIAGLGYALPPKVLSSHAIEDRLAPVYDRLNLPHGRLEMMTGIRERRYWLVETTPSSAAIEAGRHALSRTRVSKDTIVCIVHASVCRDFLEPATANVVHNQLGLRRECQVFDVSNACLGVLNGMLLVANMIELGQIDAGMVVAGEIGKGLVDTTIEKLLADPAPTRKSIKSCFASLTIGSGGAAVILTRRQPDQPRLAAAVVRAATEHNSLCRGGDMSRADTGVGGASALDMNTDSEALLKAGITLADTTFTALLEEVGWSREEIDRVIGHQVGRAHDRALFEALRLDTKKSLVTYDRLGNVGSVSVPMTLALAVEERFIERGQRVTLLGIGSGLSSIMMGVEW